MPRRGLTLPGTREDAIRALDLTGYWFVHRAFAQALAGELAVESMAARFVTNAQFYQETWGRDDLLTAQVPGSGVVNEFTTDLEGELSDFFGESVFTDPLAFNERVLQRYPDPCSGVNPHADDACCRNMIVIAGLQGSAHFRLYTKRGGSVTSSCRIEPGSVMVVKAPGFLGGNDQPVHSVTHVKNDRLILALRQVKE